MTLWVILLPTGLRANRAWPTPTSLGTCFLAACRSRTHSPTALSHLAFVTSLSQGCTHKDHGLYKGSEPAEISSPGTHLLTCLWTQGKLMLPLVQVPVDCSKTALHASRGDHFLAFLEGFWKLLTPARPPHLPAHAAGAQRGPAAFIRPEHGHDPSGSSRRWPGGTLHGRVPFGVAAPLLCHRPLRQAQPRHHQRRGGWCAHPPRLSR